MQSIFQIGTKGPKAETTSIKTSEISLQNFKMDDYHKQSRTVSARDLLHMDIRTSYAVLSVVPGLNPILRAPGDTRSIPVSQQKRCTNSFDQESVESLGKIEAIFSDNGSTWDHMKKLPSGSTIMGRGFYLRKSDGSQWVLLLGAASDARAKAPKYFLWSMLNTLRLGSIDFEKTVVKILQSLFLLAFKCEACTESDSEESFGACLNNVKAMSQEGDRQQQYQEYLERELLICRHFLDVMREIGTSTTARSIEHVLTIGELEDKLKLPQGNLQPWCREMCRRLGAIIAMRDWVPRSQLIFSLELVLQNLMALGRSDGEIHGNGNVDYTVMNKMIAAHEHITQQKFQSLSASIVEQLAKPAYDLKTTGDWTRPFEDSDEEEGDQGEIKRKAIEGMDDAMMNHAQQVRYKDDESDGGPEYLDDDSKCAGERLRMQSLFKSWWGYGESTFSCLNVLSLHDEQVPLYFVALDHQRLKIRYNDRDGLPIAYVFHKQLLKQSLDSYHHRAEAVNGDKAVADGLISFREELLTWLVNLVRSPLPTVVIEWFLHQVESGPTTNLVPALSCTSDQSCSPVDEDMNLLILAHCIAISFPCQDERRELIRKAFNLPEKSLRFCVRKNDTYGIHIVRTGTYKALRENKIVFHECNLGYDALTMSKDNASMYLFIIEHFSKATCIVYVRGLDTIDDRLLKWLAEYTKAHPWRFIFLENTQTSWNFSENRDRCVFDHAPTPVERHLRDEADLRSPSVAVLRPAHMQTYPRLQEYLDRKEISDVDLAAMKPTDLSTMLLEFFYGEKKQDWSLDRKTATKVVEDYRKRIQDIVEENAPCVLLLCSPPGAGKSHFANDIADSVHKKYNRQKVVIDGSDDRLVETALAEILENALPDQGQSRFLILDEFHMLSDAHKEDFFRWLRPRAKSLMVLLIANRKDSRDDAQLEKLQGSASDLGLDNDRIAGFNARLEKNLIDQVMESNHVKRKKEIQQWMHCCRCIFGGDSISLRNIKNLDELFELTEKDVKRKRLTNLLLDKVPVITEHTAKEFVHAFMESIEGGEMASPDQENLASTLLQVALQSMDNDCKMDFPEYVANGLEHAYDATPALRLVAWCFHMCESESARPGGFSLNARSILKSCLVDQCGFPLQLQRTNKALRSSEGLAFSWGGDYSRMKDLIDAVKRGHSIDWEDVRKKCWEREAVQDGALLAELLSVCTSPGKVLLALKKENLCSLLKKSVPEHSLAIAREILRYDVYLDSAEDDKLNSPYRTAAWICILYDRSLKDETDVFKLMSPTTKSPKLNGVSSSLEDRAHKLVDTLVWASTHMQDMLQCAQDDDPQARHDFLITLMKYLTKKLRASRQHNRIPQLWGGMFGKLLQFSPVQGAHRSIKKVSAFVVLYAEDANSHWKEPLPSLFAIAKYRCNAFQVAEIWEKHREFLFFKHEVNGSIKWSGRDSDGSYIHEKFSSGILNTEGSIPFDLQMSLLTHKTTIAVESLRNINHSISLVAGAIEALASLEDVEVPIQGDSFKQRVMAEMRKYRQVEDT